MLWIFTLKEKVKQFTTVQFIVCRLINLFVQELGAICRNWVSSAGTEWQVKRHGNGNKKFTHPNFWFTDTCVCVCVYILRIKRFCSRDNLIYSARVAGLVLPRVNIDVRTTLLKKKHHNYYSNFSYFLISQNKMVNVNNYKTTKGQTMKIQSIPVKNFPSCLHWTNWTDTFLLMMMMMTMTMTTMKMMMMSISQSSHIISHHIIYHIISYHIISYHIISYHIISYHIIYHISYHIISYHIISYIIYHIIYHISYHILIQDFIYTKQMTKTAQKITSLYDFNHPPQRKQGICSSENIVYW